jgi:hypothetical protein
MPGDRQADQKANKGQTFKNKLKTTEVIYKKVVPAKIILPMAPACGRQAQSKEHSVGF